MTPAVIVKHSEDLSQFIAHIDEFGLKGEASHLDIIHEQTVMDIWNEKPELMKKKDLSPDFETGQIPVSEWFFMADLAHKPTVTGFSWGKSGPAVKIIRLGDRPVWLVEEMAKRNFF